MLSPGGTALTREDYLANLVGRSDAEIFGSRLGPQADVAALTEERVRRYVELAGDGSTVSEDARAAVAAAAARVRVGVVTNALHAEVVAVLRGARLEDFVATFVCAEDVSRLKPDPEPYALACARLKVPAARAVAIEDTPAGVAAAKAAGLRCAALTTTVPRARLAAADLLLDTLDPHAVANLLGLRE